jgi:hypothetical protein
MNELRATRQKAFMGYVSLNVVNPPPGAVWGTFNNRIVDTKWVDKMAESFDFHLDNCTDQNSMDITLDPDWLFDQSAFISVIEGLLMDDVPPLKFTKQGEVEIKNNNLWMLSGNHRRLALGQYVAKMKAEVESAKEIIRSLKEGKTEGEMAKLDDAAKNKLTQAEEIIKKVAPKILKSSMWSVRVYNRGAWYHTPRGDGGPTYRTSSPHRKRTRRPSRKGNCDLQADIEECGEGGAQGHGGGVSPGGNRRAQRRIRIELEKRHGEKQKGGLRVQA